MMIVIIHELNHYLRCVKRKDVKIEDCSTGRTQSVEGGELMFNEIFGVDYMNKLDFLLQKEIMNISNWNGNNVNYFKQFFTEDYHVSGCIQFMKTDSKKYHCVERPGPIDE